MYVQEAATAARAPVTPPGTAAASSIAWAADNATLFYLTQARAPQAPGARLIWERAPCLACTASTQQHIPHLSQPNSGKRATWHVSAKEMGARRQCASSTVELLGGAGAHCGRPASLPMPRKPRYVRAYEAPLAAPGCKTAQRDDPPPRLRACRAPPGKAGLVTCRPSKSPRCAGQHHQAHQPPVALDARGADRRSGARIRGGRPAVQHRAEPDALAALPAARDCVGDNRRCALSAGGGAPGCRPGLPWQDARARSRGTATAAAQVAGSAAVRRRATCAS